MIVSNNLVSTNKLHCKSQVNSWKVDNKNKLQSWDIIIRHSVTSLFKTEQF